MLMAESQVVDYCSPLAVALHLMANEDGSELILEPQNGCLDDAGQCLDRGAIIVLADHACGLMVRRRFDPTPLATLNLRVDWISTPDPGRAVQACPRIIAHHGMTALVAVDILHPGNQTLIAIATSQMILGVAPGGTNMPFLPIASPDLFVNAKDARFANFTRMLGLQSGHEGYRLPLAPHLVGNATVSAVHGGLIGAALDRAAAQALQAVDDSRSWQPLGIWIEYMRPAILGSADLDLEPSIKRIGRTIASVECTARLGQSAKLVAQAGVNFVAGALSNTPSRSNEPDGAAS